MNLTKHQALKILQQAGLVNPARLVKLICDTNAFLQLDLSGLTVLTEAASGPYVVTPVIASLAGAKRVFALTRDSRHASTEAVIIQTQALETLCDVGARAQVHTKRSLQLFAQADIVTNLGFVRPIDAEVVAAMKTTAVIPLMCEAWEFRPGDIDLEGCRDRGILVLGTNEDYPGLDVFTYVGNLCLKMLFDAQIEVHKSNILIVSSDKFGLTVQQAVRKAGATVTLTNDLCLSENRAAVRDADVLVVADYRRPTVIIGNGGDITPMELAALAPNLTVLQFAGVIDVASLKRVGIVCYPEHAIGPHRMAFTLAELGPRPVVELHAAGLKVGELLARARAQGLRGLQAELTVLRESSLAQEFPGYHERTCRRDSKEGMY